MYLLPKPSVLGSFGYWLLPPISISNHLGDCEIFERLGVVRRCRRFRANGKYPEKPKPRLPIGFYWHSHGKMWTSTYTNQPYLFWWFSFSWLKNEVFVFPWALLYMFFFAWRVPIWMISHGRCSWEGIWTPNICLKKTPSHNVLGCLGPGRVETVWLFLFFLFYVQIFWNTTYPEMKTTYPEMNGKSTRE